MQRLGKLALIRHLQAIGKANLVGDDGALDDAGGGLDCRRCALHHARRTSLFFTRLLARQQLVATLALEDVGLFEEELAEHWVLAIKATVEARELFKFVDARADGLFGKDAARERLALAVGGVEREARWRCVGLSIVKLGFFGMSCAI